MEPIEREISSRIVISIAHRPVAQEKGGRSPSSRRLLRQLSYLAVRRFDTTYEYAQSKFRGQLLEDNNGKKTWVLVGSRHVPEIPGVRKEDDGRLKRAGVKRQVHRRQPGHIPSVPSTSEMEHQLTAAPNRGTMRWCRRASERHQNGLLPPRERPQQPPWRSCAELNRQTKTSIKRN